MWSYNNSIKDDEFNLKPLKNCWAQAGFDGLATTCMPVQRPYNPNAKRIAGTDEADLAKIGVKAEIKSFECEAAAHASWRTPDGHAGLDRRMQTRTTSRTPARLRFCPVGCG
jgi:ABC-type transport system substrate-binding protein